MDTVRVKRNTNGDSRVADHTPTITEFDSANSSHRKDVAALMSSFADEIKSRGLDHDWTKTEEPYRSIFYRDMCNAIEGTRDFFDGEWHELHYIKLERHHITRACPYNVNLIDVVEMVCDCVAAGMARSGNVDKVIIPAEFLERAVENTVELLKDSIILEEDNADDTEIL